MEGPVKKRQRTAASGCRGFSGFLCTCETFKEKEATKDSLNLLNQYADLLYPIEEEKETTLNEKTLDASSIQKELEKEILELKQNSKKASTGRFQPQSTGAKGNLIFKSLDSRIDPVHVATYIAKQVQDTQTPLSRYIIRFIPLQEVIYPSVEDMEKCVPGLITTFFENHTIWAKEGCSFAIDLKKRICNHIKSKDIIDLVAGLMTKHNEAHRVDLSHPQVVLTIEIIRNTCGISIVSDYHALKKFNLRALINEQPVVVGAKKEKSATKESVVAMEAVAAKEAVVAKEPEAVKDLEAAKEPVATKDPATAASEKDSSTVAL